MAVADVPGPKGRHDYDIENGPLQWREELNKKSRTKECGLSELRWNVFKPAEGVFEEIFQVK